MHLVGIKNIFDRKYFRNLNEYLLFDEVLQMDVRV